MSIWCIQFDTLYSNPGQSTNKSRDVTFRLLNAFLHKKELHTFRCHTLTQPNGQIFHNHLEVLFYIIFILKTTFKNFECPEKSFNLDFFTNQYFIYMTYRIFAKTTFCLLININLRAKSTVIVTSGKPVPTTKTGILPLLRTKIPPKNVISVSATH